MTLLIAQKNDIEQFRPFFELLVGITEEVFNNIQNWTDEIYDRIGGSTKKPYPENICRMVFADTESCLEGNSFTYDKIWNISSDLL